MKAISLEGVTVATVLPFADDFSIDWKSYDNVLGFCTTPAGINAVFVNGHAGEGAALTEAEKREVITRTRAGIGRKPLLTGIIPYSTADAVRQARLAAESDVDGLVLFPMPQFAAGASSDPRYLLDYVEAVLDAVPLPVSIFQMGVASGLGFTTSVLAEAARNPRVIAVKEGSGDIAIYEDNWRVLKGVSPDIAILPSNYHWIFAQLAVGADGILSGMASLVPQLLSDIWEATKAQDLVRMRALNDQLYPIVRTIYGAPPLIDMHTRLKVGLQHMGIIADARPRPPLLPVPAEVSKRIVAALAESKSPEKGDRL